MQHVFGWRWSVLGALGLAAACQSATPPSRFDKDGRGLAPPPAVAAPQPPAGTAQAGSPGPSAAATDGAEGAKATAPDEGTAPAVGHKVELQFFVMSQCPFGVQVLEGVVPALRQLGPWVDFKLDFIGQIEGDRLTSMHGENEVAGDIVELCTLRHVPDRWLDLFACWNKEYQSLPGNWRSCATRNGLDAATIDRLAACIDGPDGKAMLRASFEKARARGVGSSPTIFLDGSPWPGGRDERAFLQGICKALGEPQPAPCAAIPPPPTVRLLVLGDRRCTKPECNTANIIGQLRGVFGGLVVTERDWNTPEGKATYAEYGLRYLPAYLFDGSVEADATGMQSVGRFLRPTAKEGWRSLDVAAHHDPNAEICDNGVDDTGDGKVDCADDTCRQVLACRPEIKGDLQLFVMSQCPYGVQALDAMREVLAAFGDEIRFDVHFIADVQGEGFGSLHGQPEVEEDIRELCAKQLYRNGNRFMEYIWCRDKDIHGAGWRECATAAGMDVARFEACATGEQGRQLLRADLAIAHALSISSSPTFLVNNKVTANAVDARSIQQLICKQNPQFRGCGAELSGPPPAPQGAGGGCGAPTPPPSGGGCGG